MTAVSVDPIRARLLQERESLRTQIERLGNSTQEFGTQGYHVIDDATWVTEQARNVALLRHEKHLLEQVERALERLSAGTYGLCEGCGASIPLARLEAIPYASLCLDCQQRLEKTASA